jgi:transcriptional regulator with XRE-family HTH domain
MLYDLAMSRARPIDARIGRNVRALRALRYIRQEDLAARMAQLNPTWTRQTVSDIERGHRAVLVSEALDLADCFDIDLAVLLSEKFESI